MKGLISWDEKYSVGAARIDEQHKKLFEFLNAYYDAIAQGNSEKMISATLKNLMDYTKYHFKDEEDFMSIIPGFNISGHVDEHKFFISKVAELQNKVESGENIKFDLFEFMKEWILNHILINDKKIGMQDK